MAMAVPGGMVTILKSLGFPKNLLVLFWQKSFSGPVNLT